MSVSSMTKRISASVRRMAVIVALLLPATALAGLAGAPVAGADSSGCSNNVCIGVTGPAGGTVTITAWPADNGFSGYFTAFGANFTGNSPDQYWAAADGYGDNANTYTWTLNNTPAGQYCITGYGDDGSQQGTACENVH